MSIIIFKWKKSPHCTLTAEGLKSNKNEQLYPWERLYSITTVSGNICLKFGKKDITIACLLTKEKAAEILELNKHHGPQARMEKRIRTAKGCTRFTATITYPNTKTQIPSAYHYEYKLRGAIKIIIDSCKNTSSKE